MHVRPLLLRVTHKGGAFWFCVSQRIVCALAHQLVCAAATPQANNPTRHDASQGDVEAPAAVAERQTVGVTQLEDRVWTFAEEVWTFRIDSAKFITEITFRQFIIY